MSRILIATSPEQGHLNPRTGVARWLRRLGHTVGWRCITEPAPQLARLGVDVLHPPQPEVPTTETRGEALARLVLDEAATAISTSSQAHDGAKQAAERIAGLAA